MAVIGLGEKVRISQGYALQKSYAKDPSKRAKTMVLGAVPRVSWCRTKSEQLTGSNESTRTVR